MCLVPFPCKHPEEMQKSGETQPTLVQILRGCHEDYILNVSLTWGSHILYLLVLKQRESDRVISVAFF
jgi:hypothetical protein